MKVTELIQTPTLSFEVFPSSTRETYSNVARTVAKVANLQPAYMSVTFGKSSAQSDDLAKFLSHITTVVPHLTCKLSKQELDELLTLRQSEGLENILVLRGDDIPLNSADYFQHASDLIRHIKENYNLCIGAACYPEGHQEDISQDTNIQYTKLKQDMGADYLVTQMFFENSKFYVFFDHANACDVHIPIIPAIMPITSYKSYLRCKNSFGVSIPQMLQNEIEQHRDYDEAIYQIGLNHAVSQIHELIWAGFKNIHVYIMNSTRLAEDITKAVTPLLV